MPGASLLESLRIQLRVIGALLMREILTRYGRHNIGFLWLFVQPMIGVVMITLVWTVIRLRHFDNISIVAFAVTGFSSLMLWRPVAGRCMSAVNPNKSLLYHRQVTVLDFFLARIVLEDAAATMAFVFLVIIFALFAAMPLPLDPLQVFVGWAMLAWFGFGLALLLGALAHRFPSVDKIWRPASYILWLCSGVMFPVDALPPRVIEIILWLPMVSGLEYLREGYFGPVITFHYDMLYMTTANLVLTIAGLLAVGSITRRGALA
jgi:ABC-type polysaccharide/polyol phosphate export permease